MLTDSRGDADRRVAGYARVSRWPNSKSMPIWNINRIRPIWLMMVIGVDARAPNSASEAPERNVRTTTARAAGPP